MVRGWVGERDSIPDKPRCAAFLLFQKLYRRANDIAMRRQTRRRKQGEPGASHGGTRTIRRTLCPGAHSLDSPRFDVKPHNLPLNRATSTRPPRSSPSLPTATQSGSSSPSRSNSTPRSSPKATSLSTAPPSLSHTFPYPKKATSTTSRARRRDCSASCSSSTRRAGQSSR